MITVIYSIRNRDPDHLRRSVESLREHSGVSFEVNVVDYGSEGRFREEIDRVCREMSLNRIRCESQGLPWCKSHAINIGVRNTETRYVITVDVDMTFESDILEVALEHVDKDVAVHCRPLWVPKSGNRSEARLGDYSQVGGFQCIRRDAFEKLGGYDERIKYWGNEDLEWVNRLRKNGYRLKWIDSEARMYHTWHPRERGMNDSAPYSAVPDTWSVMAENAVLDTCPNGGNGEWGRNISPEERPILARMEQSDPEQVAVDHYIRFLSEEPERLKNAGFVCLELGKRFYGGRDTTGWQDIMTFVQYHILNRIGYEVKPKKNANFDQWYASLPHLKEAGLVDFYIAEAKDKVYLLFE